MQKFFDALLNIPLPDPEDARRRRLLNILLAGTFVSGFLAVLTMLGVFLFSREMFSRPGMLYILPTAAAFMGGALIIYVINRRSGRWAAFTFLLWTTIALSYSDIPAEVANGRSLFVFTFPIVMSSLILFPAAGFIFAAISSGIVLLLAALASVVPNVPAMIGFLLLALVAWVASRSLEQTLRELRFINANLDKLVVERTQALAEALGRERAEAGRRQAILTSIADGVLVFDKDQVITLANAAAANLLEMPVEQMVNKTLAELLQTPALSEREQGLLRSAFESRTQPGAFRVTWGKRTLSVSAASVRISEDEDIGAVLVFRDVTHEAELERMKSTFIAIVSHELRTPLSAIMGLAEMLREGVYGPVTEKQATASERILLNTRHMLAMVGDLLDQAQIEAGKLKIVSEAFKPAELLKNVQDVMNPIVTEKGLSLTTELDARLPVVLRGDPQRLLQILMNLVNNAIKFTDSGSIHVRLFLPDAEHWGLEVRDSGRGIPPEEIEHIFDAFHRVDSTTTREQRGVGLGLSIVKQLVHLMQGEVQVQSLPGRGSTFTITLPLTDGDVRRYAMTPTALIIEDDADLALVFAEALRSAGYEAHVIHDGAVAQRRIKEVVPHIVILDLHLPHVDGPTLLTQIRADGVLKDTIVIVATADALLGEVYREAADIVLIKPISFIQLRDMCARLRMVRWGAEAKM